MNVKFNLYNKKGNVTKNPFLNEYSSKISLYLTVVVQDLNHTL